MKIPKLPEGFYFKVADRDILGDPYVSVKLLRKFRYWPFAFKIDSAIFFVEPKHDKSDLELRLVKVMDGLAEDLMNTRRDLSAELREILGNSE